MNERSFMIRVKILMFLWVALGLISIYSAVASMVKGETKDWYLFLAFTFIAGLMIALNSRRAKLYRDKMRKEQERQKK